MGSGGELAHDAGDMTGLDRGGGGDDLDVGVTADDQEVPTEGASVGSPWCGVEVFGE